MLNKEKKFNLEDVGNCSYNQIKELILNTISMNECFKIERCDNYSIELNINDNIFSNFGKIYMKCDTKEFMASHRCNWLYIYFAYNNIGDELHDLQIFIEDIPLNDLQILIQNRIALMTYYDELIKFELIGISTSNLTYEDVRNIILNKKYKMYKYNFYITDFMLYDNECEIKCFHGHIDFSHFGYMMAEDIDGGIHLIYFAYNYMDNELYNLKIFSEDEYDEIRLKYLIAEKIKCFDK